MSAGIDLSELHWLLDIVQSIDVGIVVIDRDYKVQVWNGFMENHSGLAPDAVQDKPFFELFPEIPQDSFRRKVESVRLLQHRAFTIWEQRPYLVKFRNYQPITGLEEFMFQNVTLLPLASSKGSAEHICLIIYDVTDIATNKRQLEKANAELAELSRIDRLTQLYNRGHWEECLKREYARFKRYGDIASLVMMDIDHFKSINDKHGHPVGDRVIQMVADALRSNLRTTDIAGRYGGEEFAVILTETRAAQAMVFAERVREQIAALRLPVGGNGLQWTVSLGIAEIDAQCSSERVWLTHADNALYASKHNGRNRVSVHGQSG